MTQAARDAIAAAAARPWKAMKVSWDAEQGTLTVRMNIRPVQCFSLSSMKEYLSLFKTIDDNPGAVRHFVLASATPGVFNFGGDLALFVLLTRAKDLDSLRMYGRMCLDLVWWLENAAQRNIHTVALLQGDALGGGLESALPFHSIVAERGTVAGFPEVLFNLFPGMGAWNFTTRKAGLAIANEMVLSGKTYTAAELQTMGVVDVVADEGQGEAAVQAVIRGVSPRLRGVLTALRARQRVAPIARKDLDDIVDDWARAALDLTDRDLRLMERLVRAQLKKVGGAEDGAIEEIKRMELEEALAA